MKLNKRTYIYIFLSIFGLFLCINYRESIVDAVINVADAAMPIIIGLAIAYILNILMSFYERHYFAKHHTAKAVQKSRRIVCLLASIVTLVGIGALIVWLVIPELMSCIKLLAAEIPPAMERVLSNDYIIRVLPESALASLSSVNWNEYIEKFVQMISGGIGSAAETLFTAVGSAVSSVITGFIGIVFSIYLLLGKEKLQNQSKKLLKSYLPMKAYKKIIYVLSVFNESFH